MKNLNNETSQTKVRNFLANRKKTLLISLLLFIVLIESVVLLNFKHQSSDNSPHNLPKLAKEIADKCSITNYPPTCYDNEIPKLMYAPANLSMEESFEVTKLVQEFDPSYQYCHVLGHKLSAIEVQKDPSKWKEVASRCPSGVCSNGCIHGGFQEKFRAESFTDEQLEEVKPDLKTICEKRSNWNPTGLEQASCYHALGHLTMYLTEADINKSIKLCEEISLKEDGRDLTQTCFDGAFMQIFQPLEAEDFALIKGKEVTRDKVDSFCNGFSGKQRGSCIGESWPLFSKELKTAEGVVKFCSRQEPAGQDRCYGGIFYVLTAQFNFDLNKIGNYCSKLPEKIAGKCFANASSRMIETDYRNISKSVELCSNTNSTTSQSACFEELINYSTFNFHVNSNEFFQLCNSLPDPWKEKCLNRS